MAGQEGAHSVATASLFKFGKLSVAFTSNPLVIAVQGADGRIVQRLTFDPATGNFTFLLGDGPGLGLGAGSPQYDRRGSAHSMKNSPGAYQLATHSGRLPIPWLVGTSGRAMFVHSLLDGFDLTGREVFRATPLQSAGRGLRSKESPFCFLSSCPRMQF